MELAESFKYAAPAAAALGVDTEHMAAMFAIMAKNGIKASEAGVAVRSMMVRMVRPTNIAVAALSKYGIDFADYLTGKRETTPEDIVTMLAAAGINAAPVTQAIGEILAKGLGPAQLREELTSAVVGGLGGGSAVDKGLISDILNEALFGNGDSLDLERLISDMQAAGISTADFFRIFDVRQGARTLGLFSDDVGRWVENIQSNSDGFAAALRDTRMQGVVGAVIREPFQHENEARDAAETTAKNLGRGEASASFEIDGDPMARAEAFVEARNLRNLVDGLWRATTVTHTFSSTAPYKTSIECELPDGAEGASE